jgi:hypothetical protein
MRNSRHTLIELSGNQRFVLAYVPTGSLYDVNEGDEVTIKKGFTNKARHHHPCGVLCGGASTRVRPLLGAHQAAPDLVLSPQIRGTGQRAHPARDVLHRCYTGYSLLCQGEMLSKF